MADLSKLSHRALVDTATRLKATAVRLRERSGEIAERGAGAAITLVSGAGYAYARGRYAEAMGWEIPGTDIPAAPLAAGVVALLGVTGYGGKASEMMTHAGVGALTSEASLRLFAAGQRAAVAAK